MIQVKVAGTEWWYDEMPSPCPLCHHAIDARFLTGVVRQNNPMGTVVELVFQCPRNKCLQAFIGYYDGQYDRNLNAPVLFLRASAPFTPIPPTHPKDVAALSAQFVAIYGEATAAEARGLKQVAGCGYRKAVEFLIKDFCVKENPADAEAIKTQRLGTVIQERISDPNIKAMAARATWIGNDETHYVRIWTDKDMTDLKALMSLTVSCINTHLLTRKYVKEMPEGGAG